MPLEERDLNDRTPTGVFWSGDQCNYKVGECGVTGMLMVRVPGPMGYHPWIEVYKGDTLVVRVNCSTVEMITYT